MTILEWGKDQNSGILSFFYYLERIKTNNEKF